MRNFRLTLCYDGGRYDGWQRQGNSENTIQGKLEGLLSRLLDQNVEIAGSGRTDAGVHALAQVCSFRAETALDCETLLAEIRRYLPEDNEPNVFERKWMISVPQALDLDAMRRASAPLLGEHDFSAFCANRHMKKTAVRTLRRIEITRMGGEIRIALTADGFLYHMVRIIVGTLLEVGEGKRAAEDIPAVLASRDRMEAGPTAPAQGLTLWSVKY